MNEEIEIDHMSSHSNEDGTWCCPHCMRSSIPQGNPYGTEDAPRRVTCKKCNKDFAAWQEEIQKQCSAKIEG